MDRYWFLTNTTYGTWLPGDQRGFVGRVWEHREEDDEEERRIEHALHETPYDANIPKLEMASQSLMKGPPILLNKEQAEVTLNQFRETALIRHWELLAVSIMLNHFHMVVGVMGDPKPGKILGDFKSYATRTLSKKFGAPASETWWTERGSKRKIKDETSLNNRVVYTLYKQPNPLVSWSPGTGLHFGIPPDR